MKNIINEKPIGNYLTGRLTKSVDFVEDKDIKNKKVLDIGCGFGWCEVDFLERGVEEVVGIDLSECSNILE